MIFRSECCVGEKCFCGEDADHKLHEHVFDDDPLPWRHELTRYVCHHHFVVIMGPAAKDERDE